MVVLNIGGMIESAWIKEDDNITAALIAWQGGMEGGRACADLLCGDGNPSGKLTDTFARTLEDYPSGGNFHESNQYAEYKDDIYVGYRYFETIPEAAKKVVYPFGYGLSYTQFRVKPLSMEICEAETDSIKEGGMEKARECRNSDLTESRNKEIQIKLAMTNIGDRAGKEVVQLYYSAPKGSLGKPEKVLGGFRKTKLLMPGETQKITMKLPVSQMASYDDLGKIQKSAWILEKGEYKLYIGTSVRDLTDREAVYVQETDEIICQLSPKLVPSKLTERMLCDGSYEKLETSEYEADKDILERMPTKETEAFAPQERAADRYFLGKKNDLQFADVADGKMTLDEFLKKLSVEEKAELLGGQRNLGVSNTFGLGNMPKYGIPEITTADGPAGLRILPQVGVCTTAWPCATMLACSFNPELAEQIGRAAAEEVKENNIGVWLAPAVNIHRSPLCGRNFEYYSEDPYLSGKIGAAVVRGVQSRNIAATVKHFAFNNKETNRKNSDSRLSERAAREIYLKAFEIIVKEASPWCIMTAYNKVNGIHCSENKELLNGILRDEWGFDGLVVTDWWTSGEHYLEVKAGNDLKMGCGYPERIMEAYKKGAVSEEELDACVKNVLTLILRME